MKTEVQWPGESGLPFPQASHCLPTTVPSPPRGRAHGGWISLEANFITSPPQHHQDSFGLLKHTTCFSLLRNRNSAARAKLSVLLHWPSALAGGTESLTSLISLSPAQLAYPATQSDTPLPGAAKTAIFKDPPGSHFALPYCISLHNYAKQ